MKVLHIGLDDTLGGIERFIINYFNACSSNVFFGFITTVNEFKYSLDDMIKNKKYQVHHVTDITNPVKYVLSVKMIIDQFNYDVVHIHKNSLANILPIIAAKLSHVDKIIVHAHSSQPSRHRMIGSVLHKINKNFLCQFKTQTSHRKNMYISHSHTPFSNKHHQATDFCSALRIYSGSLLTKSCAITCICSSVA